MMFLLKKVVLECYELSFVFLALCDLKKVISLSLVVLEHWYTDSISFLSFLFELFLVVMKIQA